MNTMQTLILLTCERVKMLPGIFPMSMKGNVFWLPASNLLSRLPLRLSSGWLAGFRHAGTRQLTGTNHVILIPIVDRDKWPLGSASRS